MTIIDLTIETKYHPLIVATEQILTASTGDIIKIIVSDTAICREIKNYLIGSAIGFREIYDGDHIILQFDIK